MSQTLTRRRFTRLALLSTATAAIATLPQKTLAHPAPLLYGISVHSGRMTLQALDLMTGKLQARPDLISGMTLRPGDRLIDATSLTNGTLAVAIAPSRHHQGDTSPRLLFLGKSSTTLTVRGLDKNLRLKSVLGTKDGALIGLVTPINGRSPLKLASIHQQSGQIGFITQVNPPGNKLVNNLTECPDGKIYLTAVGQHCETSLVQLDRGKLIELPQLRFNNRTWMNSMRSLACSPSGQLFALGSGKYEPTRSLFRVEPTTGVMTKLRPFQVNEITFGRA